MPSELLIITGKPGSGKSTASKLAALRIEGARHISMGERLRAISRGETASRYAEELASSETRLAQHKAVGRPQLPVLILEEFIGEEEGSVIVDGFPRYPDRVGMFREMLRKTGHHILAVCQIDVSEQVSLDRMDQRETRSHIVVEDEAFRRRRINDYYDEVIPVVGELKTFAPLYFIDGHRPPEEVADQLVVIHDLSTAKAWSNQQAT